MKKDFMGEPKSKINSNKKRITFKLKISYVTANKTINLAVEMVILCERRIIFYRWMQVRYFKKVTSANKVSFPCLNYFAFVAGDNSAH